MSTDRMLRLAKLLDDELGGDKAFFLMVHGLDGDKKVTYTTNIEPHRAGEALQETIDHLNETYQH